MADIKSGSLARQVKNTITKKEKKKHLEINYTTKYKITTYTLLFNNNYFTMNLKPLSAACCLNILRNCFRELLQ